MGYEDTASHRRAPMKILIAGGGIGGLSAALCALHFGHEVRVFEAARELGDVGAGIQLPPNAMRVFKALDLVEALEAAAFEPTAIEARMGESGRHVFNVRLSDYARGRWGAPYLHIHRADYIDVLRTALEQRAPDALTLGASVVRYDQTGEGASVTLSDGRVVTGDVVIGADGIRSAIQAQMLGPLAPSFTGNVAWRAVVPMAALGDLAPHPTSCAWFGRGKHAVTYRLRGGELVNFVGVVERDDWREEGWSVHGDKDDLRADFAGWHPVITNLIEAVPDDNLYRWALFDRAPLPRWTDGRAALLGDAAHPMLPFWAQGAAMAVEDAWVLGRALSDYSAGDALSRYAAIRRPRASEVQAKSRANMGTFHKHHIVSQIATYGPMWAAGHILPGIIRARFDALYGYDVTRIEP